MGKLNIAHHKSYHPYRRDNIERVRRDEEEARLNEMKEEGKMKLADSEARMDLLRNRAGLGTKGKGKRRSPSPEQAATLTSLETGGHVNLFADIEANEAAASFKSSIDDKSKPKWGGKDAEKEDDKGVRLGPSQKDLNPWYVSKSKEPATEKANDADERRKAKHDPLTFINHQLSSSSPAFRHPPPPKSKLSSQHSSSSDERLSRESSERERALALIRRKQREKEIGSMTPSTVYDDGDLYNRREVEEAGRRRERWKERRW